MKVQKSTLHVFQIVIKSITDEFQILTSKLYVNQYDCQ
jgi:hypothetical protein